MASMPKPSVADLRQGGGLDWFDKYDREVWEGQMTPGLIQQSDPYHLGYNIAAMRSMNAEQRAALIARFNEGKNHWAGPSAKTVAGVAVKESRKEFVADLGKAETEYLARARTAREQLAAIERRLGAAATVIAKGPKAGTLEDAAAAGKGFDGAAPKTGSDAPPVDARTEKIGPGTIVAGKPKSGLQDSSSAGTQTGAPAEKGVRFNEIPAPKVDEEQGKTTQDKKGISLGSKVGAMLKTPKIMGIAGGLLGGIIGFFLGGPIGALLGAAAGAAALGLGAKCFS